MFKGIQKKYQANPGQFNYGLSRVCFFGADIIEMETGLKGGLADHRLGAGLSLAVACSAFTFLLDECIGMYVGAIPEEDIARKNCVKKIGSWVGVTAGAIYFVAGIAMRDGTMVATGALFTASPLVEFRRETPHWNPRPRKSGEPFPIFARRQSKLLIHNILHHPPKVAAVLNAAGFAMLPFMLDGAATWQKTLIVGLGLMGVWRQARAEGVQKNPRQIKAPTIL